MRKRIRTKGFSLIEVLVAIGVVSVGILALLAVFITGSRSNQHGENLSRALFYARRITETIRADPQIVFEGAIPPPESSGVNDPPDKFRPLDESPPSAFLSIRAAKVGADGLPVIEAGKAVLDPGDDKFERNIQIQRLSDNAADYQFRLLKMKVTVRWQGGRSGDGMRNVHVSSLIK